jgi:IPT/TIG domain
MIWYNVEISIDGGRELAGPPFRFTYYKEPKITDIQPDSGPIRGGTRVNVVGSGFNQEGACNKTVRFSVFETKPVIETNDTSAIVLSPAVSVPDAVVVAVALNG